MRLRQYLVKQITFKKLTEKNAGGKMGKVDNRRGPNLFDSAETMNGLFDVW